MEAAPYYPDRGGGPDALDAPMGKNEDYELPGETQKLMTRLSLTDSEPVSFMCKSMREDHNLMEPPLICAVFDVAHHEKITYRQLQEVVQVEWACYMLQRSEHVVRKTKTAMKEQALRHTSLWNPYRPVDAVYYMYPLDLIEVSISIHGYTFNMAGGPQRRGCASMESVPVSDLAGMEVRYQMLTPQYANIPLLEMCLHPGKYHLPDWKYAVYQAKTTELNATVMCDDGVTGAPLWKYLLLKMTQEERNSEALGCARAVVALLDSPRLHLEGQYVVEAESPWPRETSGDVLLHLQQKKTNKGAGAVQQDPEQSGGRSTRPPSDDFLDGTSVTGHEAEDRVNNYNPRNSNDNDDSHLMRSGIYTDIMKAKGLPPLPGMIEDLKKALPRNHECEVATHAFVEWYMALFTGDSKKIVSQDAKTNMQKRYALMDVGSAILRLLFEHCGPEWSQKSVCTNQHDVDEKYVPLGTPRDEMEDLIFPDMKDHPRPLDTVWKLGNFQAAMHLLHRAVGNREGAGPEGGTAGPEVNAPRTILPFQQHEVVCTLTLGPGSGTLEGMPGSTPAGTYIIPWDIPDEKLSADDLLLKNFSRQCDSGVFAGYAMLLERDGVVVPETERTFFKQVCTVGTQPTSIGAVRKCFQMHIMGYDQSTAVNHKFRVAVLHFLRPEYSFQYREDCRSVVNEDVQTTMRLQGYIKDHSERAPDLTAMGMDCGVGVDEYKWFPRSVFAGHDQPRMEIDQHFTCTNVSVDPRPKGGVREVTDGRTVCGGLVKDLCGGKIMYNSFRSARDAPMRIEMPLVIGRLDFYSNSFSWQCSRLAGSIKQPVVFINAKKIETGQEQRIPFPNPQFRKLTAVFTGLMQMGDQQQERVRSCVVFMKIGQFRDACTGVCKHEAIAMELFPTEYYGDGDTMFPNADMHRLMNLEVTGNVRVRLLAYMRLVDNSVSYRRELVELSNDIKVSQATGMRFQAHKAEPFFNKAEPGLLIDYDKTAILTINNMHWEASKSSEDWARLKQDYIRLRSVSGNDVFRLISDESDRQFKKRQEELNNTNKNSGDTDDVALLELPDFGDVKPLGAAPQKINMLSPSNSTSSNDTSATFPDQSSMTPTSKNLRKHIVTPKEMKSKMLYDRSQLGVETDGHWWRVFDGQVAGKVAVMESRWFRFASTHFTFRHVPGFCDPDTVGNCIFRILYDHGLGYFQVNRSKMALQAHIFDKQSSYAHIQVKCYKRMLTEYEGNEDPLFFEEQDPGTPINNNHPATNGFVWELGFLHGDGFLFDKFFRAVRKALHGGQWQPGQMINSNDNFFLPKAVPLSSKEGGNKKKMKGHHAAQVHSDDEEEDTSSTSDGGSRMSSRVPWDCDIPDSDALFGDDDIDDAIVQMHCLLSESMQFHSTAARQLNELVEHQLERCVKFDLFKKSFEDLCMSPVVPAVYVTLNLIESMYMHWKDEKLQKKPFSDKVQNWMSGFFKYDVPAILDKARENKDETMEAFMAEMDDECSRGTLADDSVCDFSGVIQKELARAQNRMRDRRYEKSVITHRIYRLYDMLGQKPELEQEYESDAWAACGRLPEKSGDSNEESTRYSRDKITTESF